jgi:hypothetical protein
MAPAMHHRRGAVTGWPSSPRTSVRTARAARAIAGGSTQLSWDTTPEKTMCPGHRASRRSGHASAEPERAAPQHEGEQRAAAGQDRGRVARDVEGRARHHAQELAVREGGDAGEPGREGEERQAQQPGRFASNGGGISQALDLRFQVAAAGAGRA